MRNADCNNPHRTANLQLSWQRAIRLQCLSLEGSPVPLFRFRLPCSDDITSVVQSGNRAGRGRRPVSGSSDVSHHAISRKLAGTSFRDYLAEVRPEREVHRFLTGEEGTLPPGRQDHKTARSSAIYGRDTNTASFRIPKKLFTTRPALPTVQLLIGQLGTSWPAPRARHTRLFS